MQEWSNSSVGNLKLHIWQGEDGLWRCEVHTLTGLKTIQLTDQSEISEYIDAHIEQFMCENEMYV